MIMQESTGNIRVETTITPEGAFSTAGLLQCIGCSSAADKEKEAPLTQEDVTEMIRGGITTLKENLTQLGAGPQQLNEPEFIYPALRKYNSGSVNKENLSDGIGATASYVSDIAVRLQGEVL